MGRELRAQRFEHRYGVSSREVELLQLSSPPFVVCIHITIFPRKAASFLGFFNTQKKENWPIMLYSVDEKYPVAAACPYICPLLSAASLLSHPPASFPPLARAHTHTRARARSYNNFDFAVTKCSARSDWSKRLKKNYRWSATGLADS